MTIRGVVQKRESPGFLSQEVGIFVSESSGTSGTSAWQSGCICPDGMFPGVLPIIAYTVGSALMGYFIRLRVYERVGVSLVEVCEWVGKYVISVVKRLKRADRSDTFYVCEKVERTFCFCFLNY